MYIYECLHSRLDAMTQLTICYVHMKRASLTKSTKPWSIVYIYIYISIKTRALRPVFELNCCWQKGQRTRNGHAQTKN